MSGPVLVTGGNGFIGSYVVAELYKRDRDPLVFDRRSGGQRAIFGDVRDRTAVETAVQQCGGVIHLAGLLGTQETVKQAHAAAETNVMGTLNVLAAAHQYEVPTVVISVGNHWMINSYSISKNCAERFAQMYRNELDARVCVVRALNAYGPRQKTEPVRKIIPTFVTACIEDEPIEVYGDGEQIMDMVYVEDVASVLIDALDCQPERVVEVGTGRRTTVNEIATAVIEIVGQGSVRYSPMRPGEEENAVVVADTTTLQQVGWHAHNMVTLEQGLEKTASWYKSLRSKRDVRHVA